MRKLGIVVFGSDTGLGNQSRRLTYLLKPERILLIDNSPFSKVPDQHPEWYEGFNGYTVKGFPTNKAVDKFLDGLTHLFILENPLNWYMVRRAKQLGIKVFIHCNYEFCDNLRDPALPLPDKFVMPSKWMIADMEQRFGKDRVVYIPPPLFPNDYTDVREKNYSRNGSRHFVHVAGAIAASDRNGTLDLLESLKFTTKSFILTIHAQHPLPDEYMKHIDPRIRLKIGNQREVSDLFRDADALIMPRRYGGLCLPMGEALMCGIPVIMSDISPNDQTLPKHWLVPAVRKEVLMTRTAIDVYETNHDLLARKIDAFCDTDLQKEKIEAFDLAHTEFAPSNVIERFDQLWQ